MLIHSFLFVLKIAPSVLLPVGATFPPAFLFQLFASRVPSRSGWQESPKFVTALNASLTKLFENHSTTPLTTGTNYQISDNISNYKTIIIMATQAENPNSFLASGIIPVEVMKYIMQNDSTNATGALYITEAANSLTAGFTNENTFQVRYSTGSMTVRYIYGMK